MAPGTRATHTPTAALRASPASAAVGTCCHLAIGLGALAKGGAKDVDRLRWLLFQELGAVLGRQQLGVQPFQQGAPQPGAAGNLAAQGRRSSNNNSSNSNRHSNRLNFSSARFRTPKRRREVPRALCPRS